MCSAPARAVLVPNGGAADLRCQESQTARRAPAWAAAAAAAATTADGAVEEKERRIIRKEREGTKQKEMSRTAQVAGRRELKIWRLGLGGSRLGPPAPSSLVPLSACNTPKIISFLILRPRISRFLEVFAP